MRSLVGHVLIAVAVLLLILWEEDRGGRNRSCNEQEVFRISVLRRLLDREVDLCAPKAPDPGWFEEQAERHRIFEFLILWCVPATALFAALSGGLLLATPGVPSPRARADRPPANGAAR